MANEKNLKPQNRRTKSEQREIAKKGGKASGEKRRQLAAANQMAAKILAGKIPSSDAVVALKEMGLAEDDINIQAAILAGVAGSGIKGDVRAAEYIIGLTEDSSKQESENKPKYTGLPLEIVGGAFQGLYLNVLDRDYSDFDLEGGRGSLKSTFCGLVIIDQIERNPSFCALAVRQLKDGLADSVYSQIVWAIEKLSEFFPWLSEDYKCTKSPMIITKKSTGQKIYFRGGDQPDKIKSIKPPNGMHIGIVWIEEADQIKGEGALRNIKQSAFRGGDDGILFRSYNVPRSQQHFINKEKLIPNPHRIIHHSHFKDAPKKWLGQRFYDDAELLKEINPKAYAHEYDGEAVGNGAEVFENVTIREITDSEIDTFDNCHYGLDFGWVHPFAFNAMHYNPNRLTLYIYDERHGHRVSNRELSEILETWQDVWIIADSAEPKSIDDLKEYGYNVQGAYKGPGSREYSTKWLASLFEIVIDPERCPDTTKEFLTYEYEKTKEGEITSSLPADGEDHISACRYATSPIWRLRGQ